MDGACVPDDPCRGVVCNTPPADGCDGDTVTSWSTPGICADGICTYEPRIGSDCSESGNICRGGVCALPGPCDGVLCDECPPDVCVGSVVSRAACPGTCDEGTCSYERSDFVDCADFDEVCVDGACQDPDPCDDVTCSDPPAPRCEDVFAVTSSGPGRCEAGGCLYTEEFENCAVVAGGECAEGACIVVDPCDGVECPDGDATCIGDISVTFPGLCLGGGCTTEAAETECDPETEFCWDGECRPRSECGETRCATAPDPLCIGADSDQVLTYLSPGTCDGLVCRWDEEIEDCGALGQTCFEAECIDYVAPGPGDIEIQEIQIDPAGPDGDREWIEIVNLTSRTFDLSGMVVADDGGESFTIPDGTLLTPGRWAILAADVDEVDAAVLTIGWGGAGVFSLDQPADEIELRVGAVVVDRVAWDATWPVVEGETIGLDIDIDDPDNSLPGSWCATGFPDGTAGVPNRSCPAAADPVLVDGDLTITEIMPGSSVPDQDWFEIRNDGARDLDLSGLRIGVDASIYTVPDGVTLRRETRLIVGGSATTTPAVDVVFDGFTLPASGRITLAPGGSPLDRVVWTAAWPWASDTSMSFVGSGIDDNADPSFWCQSWLPFDDDRFGTPGDDAYDCNTPAFACDDATDCGPRPAFCASEFRAQFVEDGECVDGFCDYSSARVYTDCRDTGQICDAGTCIDP